MATVIRNADVVVAWDTSEKQHTYLTGGDLAYDGGTLTFPEFGPDRYAPEAGGGAVFCCDLLHEALPVTRGRRFAIFTFFTDAEGAQAEQEMIRQRGAGQEGAVRMQG